MCGFVCAGGPPCLCLDSVRYHLPTFKVRVLTNLLGAAERTPFDVALLDTFARASYLELDYRHEAANLERFRTELLPRLGSSVYVPRSYPAVTTRKVEIEPR